jgi:hypothetical protein
MDIFKSFTLKWWQGGLFKWGVFLLGIALGAWWPGLFSAYIPALVVIAAVFLGYITWVWLKQINAAN